MRGRPTKEKILDIIREIAILHRDITNGEDTVSIAGGQVASMSARMR